MDTLTDVANKGYCTDEFARWNQGGCDAYAQGLLREKSDLKYAALLDIDFGVTHFFAYDDTYAYDATGRHLMPYYGIANDQSLIIEVDSDPNWYDAVYEEDIAAAIEHIRRNGVLEGRYEARISTLTS